MAGTTLQSVSNALCKMRWKEPYVSDGLNAKMARVVPRGIISGGRLTASGIDQTVTIEGDPETDDLVVSYLDGDGKQFVVHLGTGDTQVNMAGVSGFDVYLALYVQYAVGASTIVQWRAYTEAQLAAAPERDYLVIFGFVHVGSPTINPATDISHRGRMDAWLAIPTGMKQWAPVLKNNGFQIGDTFWKWLTTNATVYATYLGLGYRHNGYCSFSTNSAAGGEATLYQGSYFPAKPNQLVMLRTVAKATTGVGGLPVGTQVILNCTWYDANMAVVATTQDDVTAEMDGDTDWHEIVRVHESPAGARFFRPMLYYSYTGWGASGHDAYLTIAAFQSFARRQDGLNEDMDQFDVVCEDHQLTTLRFTNPDEQPDDSAIDDFIITKVEKTGPTTRDGILNVEYGRNPSGSDHGLLKLYRCALKLDGVPLGFIDVPLKDTLYAGNMVRAYARFSCGATPIISDRFNVADVTTPTAGTFEVALGRGQASASYVVPQVTVLNTTGSDIYAWEVSYVSATMVRIKLFKWNDSTKTWDQAAYNASVLLAMCVLGSAQAS